MTKLNGRVALVTGAGRGIGRAISLALAEAGARVVVAARSADELDLIVSEIGETGGTATALTVDLSQRDESREFISRASEPFGPIDILVNNAGSRPGKDRVLVLELEEEAFDEVQRVNVRGTFLVSKAVATHMVGRGGGGKIINISSGAGKKGIAKYAAYCASKFAVIGWTQAMAQELSLIPHCRCRRLLTFRSGSYPDHQTTQKTAPP